MALASNAATIELKENINVDSPGPRANKDAKAEEKTAVVEDLAKQGEEVGVEIDPNTGISFPVKLEDGRQLNCVGVRKKYLLGFGIKIYSFGNVLLTTTQFFKNSKH